MNSLLNATVTAETSTPIGWRPWQGSNLRHTVQESSLARPAGVAESVKAREIGVSGAWSCAE